MAGKFSSFFQEISRRTFFKNLRQKKSSSSLVGSLHSYRYIFGLYLRCKRLPYTLRYCIKASLMTFLVENDVCSLKIIQVQNFIDNNVS